MTDGVIGTTAGNYRILDKISDGGMGSVYRAEHTLIGRHVAVKVLLPELTHNREIVNRFFNEARATTAIKHPGIVEVFDFGYLDNNRAYIVMELLEGMTLARRIKMRGAMPEGEAAAMLRGVCSALAAAHDKGIIHRDLKPDNLFLVADLDVPGGERVKLLDFGIAKLTDIGSAHAATKTGAVMGTPTYMSPEQCRGSGDVDLRADIYSLGCIFYQLLTGKPPFAMEGAGEVIGMHLYVQPEPPSRHALGISADTEAVVMAMLSKDPAGRPQTARDLGAALSQLAHAHGWNSSSGTAWNPDGSQSFRPSFTPAYNVPVEPTPIRPPTASPSQPTTLSGAASQSVAAPPKAKKGPLIAIGAAVLVVGGVVAFSALGGGGDKPKDSKPAAAIAPPVTPPPTPTPPAPPPVVEKAPPPVVVEKPLEEPPPTTTTTTSPSTTTSKKQPVVVKKKTVEKKPTEKKPKEPDTGVLPVEDTL